MMNTNRTLKLTTLALCGQLFVNLIGKLLLLFDAGSADFPVIKNQILSVIEEDP